MPKLTIGDARTRPAVVDRPYEIFLTEGESDEEGIEVRIRDHDGVEWFLLNIREDGRVLRETSIPKEFGFDLDRRGCLKLADD